MHASSSDQMRYSLVQSSHICKVSILISNPVSVAYCLQITIEIEYADLIKGVTDTIDP